MSQQTTGARSTGPPTGPPTDSPTTEVARDQAIGVGHSAADAGKQVTATATEQAKQLAQEATEQGRNLVGEAKTQLQGQARDGQQKAAQSLRNIADELGSMARGGEQPGPATELVRQAADRMRGLADWVGQREPGDLLDELRRFARQRPGVFLLGAATAGVLAGRLTRGAASSARSAPSAGSGTDDAGAAPNAGSGPDSAGAAPNAGEHRLRPAPGEAPIPVPAAPEMPTGPTGAALGPGGQVQPYPGPDPLGGPR